MAVPKNAAQIAAANATNTAAQRNAAAAQAAATAADAARKPILTQSIAGISGINKAVQATLAALTNPNSSQAAIDKAMSESKAALAANKANLASITPEMNKFAVDQGNIYTSSMADVDKYNSMMVNVPDAQYDVPTTSDINIKDAYALIEDTLNTYDLGELSSVIKGYMLEGLGPEQAKLLIKQNPIYKARFKGNELRLASGLNALSEAEYLGLEDTYSQVMKQYGLGDYFGTTRTARQAKLADVIGGDISAVELKSRISTVVDRVNNADPGIKAQLKEFYPGITETDLVKYFLDPKQTLPQLQEKVTSAEIGAAATAQGLNTNMTSASDLARYGIDRAAAIKGYSTIGGLLPEAQKLSGIYGEAGIDYTQTTAEQEVFKGNASAERKRKQLAALETAQFGGSAGVGTAGLSTTYLRKSSSGGQF